MQKNKAFHILSYIPLLFIISLFIKDKDAPTVRFHCGQGMILTIFWAITIVVNTVLGLVIGWLPIIGWFITWIVSVLLGLCVLALMIIGIVNAANDKEAPLPIIGQYAFYR